MAELLEKLSRRKSIVDSGGSSWESDPVACATEEVKVSPSKCEFEPHADDPSTQMSPECSPASSPGTDVKLRRKSCSGDFQEAIKRRSLLVANDGESFENTPSTNKTDFAHGMQLYAALPTPARSAPRKLSQDGSSQESNIPVIEESCSDPQSSGKTDLKEADGKAAAVEPPKQSAEQVGAMKVVHASQSQLNDRLIDLANKARGLRQDVEASIARSESVAASFSVRDNRVTWWAPIANSTAERLISPSFDMGGIGPVSLELRVPESQDEADVTCRLSLRGPWPRQQRIWVGLFVGPQLEKPREWVGEEISVDFKSTHAKGPRALCGVIFHLADASASPTSGDASRRPCPRAEDAS